MKKFFLFLITIFTALWLHASINPDDIVGVWKDGQGKGQVQIYKHNGKYYGKIIWLKNPKDVNGKPKVDRKNPDMTLRNKPVMGLVMLKDFKYDDEEWSGGRIYNPSDGKEYKAYMKLKDRNTLAVRGYIGISLLGKTDTWIRVR
jgi:uncharacterized protein (DUF2147 family)